MTYEMQDSIVVPSTPDEVYALISDVTRTGEWSQQCLRCEWDSEQRGVGARFTGFNRTPEREWQTTSEVIAATPGEHFALSVGPGRAQWGYRLRPAAGGGTELTEYTLTPPRTSKRCSPNATATAPRRRSLCVSGPHAPGSRRRSPRSVRCSPAAEQALL